MFYKKPISSASLTVLASIAAALSSMPAAAQSDVALYGVLDAGLFSTDIKSAGNSTKTTGLVSGGQAASRWGLRGTETISPNLKAKFEFESGINITNGSALNNGRAFGRSAWVALAGSWGEVRLGRQPNTTSDYFGNTTTSPFGNSFSQAGIGKSGFRAANAVRQDRVVKYISPQGQSFNFGASYSFNAKGDEQASSSNNTRAYSLAARYRSDLISIAATYDRVLPANSDTNAQNREPSAIQIGGNLHFKPVRIYAAWTTQKNGWVKQAEGAPTGSNSLGASGYFDGKVDAWLLGAQYTLNKQKIFGTFQYVDPSKKAFANGESVNVFSLGYTYDLSKRTSFYALASYFDGDLYTFQTQSHSRQLGAGVLHRF
ncbi:porin [Lampropedia puyangensis]|uniref:Porin n=1 Tax=Lampropedia puyangensis TaxID=1330072 RepID=A0A4S8EWU9_9BURK|nr:porin [Lampropedia puyangensis]THT98083.1 porin [Lampropedia puyangensis]